VENPNQKKQKKRGKRAESCPEDFRGPVLETGPRPRNPTKKKTKKKKKKKFAVRCPQTGGEPPFQQSGS